jgi:predicted HicB family RNase H-like nuclease
MPKYEPGHFKQSTYITDFQKENYDEFKVRMPKGSKEKVKALAKENHLSVNALITQSIEKTYKIDLSNPKQK